MSILIPKKAVAIISKKVAKPPICEEMLTENRTSKKRYATK
jgi:hypothetical protein